LLYLSRELIAKIAFGSICSNRGFLKKSQQKLF